MNIVDELSTFLQKKIDDSYDEGYKECGFWVLNNLKLDDNQLEKLKKHLYDNNMYDYRD